MEKTKTLTGPGGLTVELDKDEVFPDDPGNGTPAMVVLRKGRHTYRATFHCACNEGYLLADGPRAEEIELTDSQVDWLHEHEEEVHDFLTTGTGM